MASKKSKNKGASKADKREGRSRKRKKDSAARGDPRGKRRKCARDPNDYRETSLDRLLLRTALAGVISSSGLLAISALDDSAQAALDSVVSMRAVASGKIDDRRTSTQEYSLYSEMASSETLQDAMKAYRIYAADKVTLTEHYDDSASGSGGIGGQISEKTGKATVGVDKTARRVVRREYTFEGVRPDLLYEPAGDVLDGFEFIYRQVSEGPEAESLPQRDADTAQEGE